MVTLHAHFDGKTIVPDEPLALAPNQRLRITIETVDEMPAEKKKRESGRQRGVLIYMAPDFNDELGDEFWLGEDK